MRSFSDPDTNFTFLKEERSIGGGLIAEVYTGEVQCDECGAAAMNHEGIPHDQDCDQRGTHSRWYVRKFFDRHDF